MMRPLLALLFAALLAQPASAQEPKRQFAVRAAAPAEVSPDKVVLPVSVHVNEGTPAKLVEPVTVRRISYQGDLKVIRFQLWGTGQSREQWFSVYPGEKFPTGVFLYRKTVQYSCDDDQVRPVLTAYTNATPIRKIDALFQMERWYGECNAVRNYSLSRDIQFYFCKMKQRLVAEEVLVWSNKDDPPGLTKQACVRAVDARQGRRR